jgi:hypothetical protein
MANMMESLRESVYKQAFDPNLPRQTGSEAENVAGMSEAELAEAQIQSQESFGQAMPAQQNQAVSAMDQWRAMAQDADVKMLQEEAKRMKAMREIEKENARQMGVPFADVGQAIVADPLTGRQAVAYLPGTKQYAEAYERMQGAVGALRLVNRIQADIDQAGPSGTDMLGTRATRVGGNRSQLMSRIFQARGLGAPQGPDVELVERGLPDSTSFWSNVRGAYQGAVTLGGAILTPPIKSELKQGYQTVAEEMQQTLTDELLRNPTLIDALTDDDIGQLHPDSDLFAILIKLRGL